MRSCGPYRLSALVLLLLCILSTGCTRLREPQIADFKITGCDIKGLTSADISFSFSIDNPNKKSLSAESATGEIFISGAPVAVIDLTDAPLVVPAQSTSKAEARFTVKITDPLSMLAAGISLRDPDLSKLTANADISVKIGNSPKKIRIRNFPLNRLGAYLNFQ